MASWNLNRLLVMLGALCTILAVLAISAWDVGDAIGPESAPLLLGPVAALVLAFYAPAWMYLVAGFFLAAFPLVILFVFGAYQGIIHPGSGVEGTGLLFMLLGALLGLLGGIAGFVHGRRGAQPALGALGSTPGVLAIAAIFLVAGMILSASWANADYETLATAPGSRVDSPDATQTIHASGIQFAERDVTIPAGQLVALTLDNRDPVVHTWSYEMDGVVHTTIMPAETSTTVYLKLDRPQTIHYFCEPHSSGASDMADASMWGTLTVA